MAILSGHHGLAAARNGITRAILVALLFIAAALAAVDPAAAATTHIWPDCDTTHPCVVHHIDTVGDGTAYGETLQDFKFSMLPSSPGNLLIFTVMHVSSKTITVTDNNNGNWQTAVATTNASDGEESQLLYICGATAGTNLITIHLSQPAAHDEPLHFTYDEVSGVASAACLDSTAAANGLHGTVQPGPVTTTADGDMIFNYGEETYQYPDYDNPIGSVTPDSASALLMENIVDKYANEVSVQTAHGAFTPTLTVSGDSSSRNWNSVAAAFKASAGAGTQPTGIHITRILHFVGELTNPVSVPFPSSGNAIVVSTSNDSAEWPMSTIADNQGHTYTRVPYSNAGTDPQIFSTCLGTGTGGQNLVISWKPGSINNHVMFYDIAGAKTTGGSTGCVGATADTVIGFQGSTPNAPMIGDPVITPSTPGSVIVTTSYCGTGPPSASLTPGVVFNSVWATGMIDSSSWDSGDPYAYAYTTSTSPISFNYQMANANGEPNGHTNFDGGAIEILPGQYQVPAATCTTSNPNPNPNPQSFAAVGDFNGDCRSDILWRNASTQQVYEWFMNGTAYSGSVNPGGPTSDWVIQGAGDFNGDGYADLLWRNRTTGEVYVWLMNGATLASSGSLGSVSSDWSIAGVGDFNGDGKADILWWNSTTGQVYLWLMNGTTISAGGNVSYVSSGWNIAGIGDFNGDGKADILWRNSSTGQLYIWLMNGTTMSSSGSLGYVTSASSIAGVGDFNGDGKSDILWRNSTTGQVYLWLMNGTTISGGGNVSYVSSNWVIQGVGDYDGSGRAGILWRNSTTEQVYIWLMNGTTLTSGGSPGSPAAAWQIAP